MQRVVENKYFNVIEYNFPESVHGEVHDISFIFLGGDKTLEGVQAIKPDCGCANVQLLPDGNIVGTWNISSAIGRGKEGDVEKTIKVYFEDGQPTHIVNVKGHLTDNPIKKVGFLKLRANVKNKEEDE